MKVKSRHHLRSDEIDVLCNSIESSLGVTLAGGAFKAVEFVDADYEVVLINGKPAIMYVDDQPFLTVKDASQLPSTTDVVTIDAGTVSLVSSGADVIRPGITEAGESVETGNLVVIAEEIHSKVLAVSRVLKDGADLVSGSGKVVESIHHVGDSLSEFSV